MKPERGDEMKILLFLLSLLPMIPCPALADEPTQLHFVTGLPGSLAQSAVVDGRAYCSTSSGLLVLDVSNPAQTTQVAMLPLSGWGRGIAVSGEYVYLLVWDEGLVVINIQDPAAPRVVAVRPEPIRPSGIVLSGQHAYISDMGLGLCVVDILDPTQPQLAAAHPLSGELRCIDIDGDVVFVAADYSGLHLLDVSTPSSPALISSVDLAGQVLDVAVRDGLAYLACGFYGLRILDVKTPTAPKQIAQRNMVFDLGFSAWTHSLSLTGDHACMGLSYYGLGMVDISDPATPVDVVRQEIRGTTTATDVFDDCAYVSASHGGLVVVDIDTPSVPLVVSQFWLLGMVTDLEVANGKIWVAGGYSPPDEPPMRTHEAGLFVVDLTELFSPRVIGYCSTGLEPSRLALSGHYAYLSTEFGGIRIQDIANPAAPVEVGFMPTTTASYAHDVEGDYAYTFAGGRFVVMDVSDPSQPVEAGGCDVDWHGHLTVDGAVVYNTLDHQGLQVFDVSDPAQPTVMAWLDLPSGAQEGAVLGDHLYVANGLNGLTVVNVSDPSQPVVAGACDLPAYARSVACHWPFAYLVASEYMDERGSLHVVDISNPVAPVQVDGSDLATEAEAVAVDGSLVYVGGRGGGVMVFRHEVVSSVVVPSPLSYLRNYPNPFNPQTTITFSLERTEWAEIGVYDLVGHLLSVLADRTYPAGHHSVVWNGNDAMGRAVPSGSYVVRLETESGVEARKVSLIR